MASLLADIVFVAIGGATGAVCRYGIQQSTPVLFEKHYYTLAINLIGCFALGVIWAILNGVNAPAWLSRLLIAGFLGGFTTFSTFALDAFALIQTGRALQSALYVGSSVIGGILLCALGLKLTGKIINTITLAG